MMCRLPLVTLSARAHRTARACLMLVAMLIFAPLGAVAQDTHTVPQDLQDEAAMTPTRLALILRAIDPDAAPADGGIAFSLDDVPVLVFMDERANRMRAVVPVASTEGLAPVDMERLLQANFDTALDARYAIAGGRVWSVFIHPLRELRRDQLLSGLAQTVTLAQTYGTFYASGATSFGAGDSAALHQDLPDRLRERGQEL